MSSSAEKRVLILHPFLNYYGGAESQLQLVANHLYPQADLFTFSYNPKILEFMGIEEKRIISPFGKGLLSHLYRQMTPLYPSLVDTLSFEKYDLILSFSYAYVHGLVTPHTVPHISYIQTPMRLLWLQESDYYIYNKIPLVKQVYQTILTWQRIWDQQAAMRPDYLLANSLEVQKRIEVFWRRPSAVLHPPVDTSFYTPRGPQKKDDYFVTHGRLVRYKRVDILIQACLQAKQRLKIIGSGPEYNSLKKVAKGSSDIEFIGQATHEEKRALLQQAKGYLFAAYEDFGIAPVEALASGTPVLAFGKGGAVETLTPDTGMFFKEQTSESVRGQLGHFEEFAAQVNQNILLKQASKFSKERFIEEYTRTVDERVDRFSKEGPPLH